MRSLCTAGLLNYATFNYVQFIFQFGFVSDLQIWITEFRDSRAEWQQLITKQSRAGIKTKIRVQSASVNSMKKLQHALHKMLFECCWHPGSHVLLKQTQDSKQLWLVLRLVALLNIGHHEFLSNGCKWCWCFTKPRSKSHSVLGHAIFFVTWLNLCRCVRVCACVCRTWLFSWCVGGCWSNHVLKFSICIHMVLKTLLVPWVQSSP